MKSACSTWMRRLVGVFALLAIVASPAMAQDTTSEIRGKIFDPTGQPVSGAMVVVRDMRTGIDRNYTSNNSGVFLATRLPVGGPYKVTIDSVKTVDVPSISLGDTYNLTINLQQAAAIEEIVTIGQAAAIVDTAAGPASTYSLADLESSVAFNRDIKDVYAADPRLNLDGFQINCAGKHPRFNSITLDGISTNDRFGLNTNGYSTATGQPFPFDAIEQVAVELAPFDVTYGGFSACNVNAVTKSGANEWEGNVFYEYSDQDLINDELDGQPLTSEAYEKTKIGISGGGAIIQDRLFFYGAYEETESPQFVAQGFAGSGNGAERPWLSQSDYERVAAIASSSAYGGYDGGGMPQNRPNEEEKILARVDWNINGDHNAAFIYNYYEGSNLRCSDSDPNEFEYANHCYTKGAEATTNTLTLSSQWTDSFSTEIFFNNNEMIDSQVTVGPKDFGDHQIDMGSNVIYIGADDSRQANRLFYKSDFFKLVGQYLAGDHIITGGYEREELEVFNIFVQHSAGGEWDYDDDSDGNPAFCDALTAQQRFDDPACGTSGIDKFELGTPNAIFYGSGGGTNVAEDAAANFTNIQNSLYLQDEVFIDHLDLSVVVGLRYDWFESDDTPVFNSNFTNTVGIRNDANVDGLDILMPRFGFTWGATPDLDVRGGVGLFSGGNPNVWLSNAYSNDGVTNVQERLFLDGDLSVFDGGIPLARDGRPGYDPPAELYDNVADTDFNNGSTSGVVFLDPNYKQPGEWKFALGATWQMPWWEMQMDVDLLYTRLYNGAIYYDMSQEQVGETVLNQPIYDYVAGERAFMLSNADGVSTSKVLSMTIDKRFDWGLDLLFGYAYTEAEDVNPMTSFVAESGWTNVATNDVNFPSRGISDYVVPHRFTLRASFAREFFGDNSTRFTAVMYTKQGQPGSYVFDANGGLEGNNRNARSLLYIPDGAGDPNVVFDPGFDQAAFFEWANARGLGSGFIPRNNQNAKWSTRLDFRVDQEVPLFFDDLKARAYLKIYNFGNMLNKDWGRQYDARFSPVTVVNGGIDAQGRYEFDQFFGGDITDLQEFSSLWELRMGIEINFR
ncbi:MAG: carboxypeptidase regulatory-like domain-containing protein [Woeseiaceae bacterium]